MNEKIEEIIISELEKITDLTNEQKIKSFILFNIKETDKVDLFNSIKTKLDEIQLALNKRIENEKNNLFQQKKPRLEKYQKLVERYKNLPDIEYPKEIYYDTLQEISKEISEYQTEGQYLKKVFNFNELNLSQYKKKRKRFKELNINIDFTNLRLYNTPEYLHYKLTEKEKEYEELDMYFKSYRNNSLIMFSENFEPEINNMLNSEFSIQYLQWYFLVFGCSKAEFDEKLNERVKYWMYSNNTIIIE